MVAARKPKRRSDDSEQLAARLAIVEAEHHRLRESLLKLITRIRRVGGYSTHEEQADLRAAEALVEETR